MTKRLRAAVIVVLFLLCGALAARGAEWYQSSDFYCLYHGSRALLVGHDPYDEVWWQSVTGGLVPLPLFRPGAVGPSACPGRYGYPLWTAVALLPLASLPLELAATLWAALSIAAAVLGAAAAWRAVRGPRSLAPVFAILLVASQPLWLLLISGQMSGIELGLSAALALALATRRLASAGVALALLALKPQVVAATIPLVGLHALLGGARRLIAGSLATAAVMVVLPMAFIPQWPLEWLDEVLGRRLRVTALLPTAWGFAADVFGNVSIGAVLCVVLVALVWLIVRGRSLTALDVLVVSLPVSLFATPYAWTYDHLVLVIPWAFLLARAPARGARRLLVLLGVLVLASLLPWTLYAVAFARGTETLSAVIPALTALAVACAIRVEHTA